jgi:beta-glucosidase
MTMYIKSVLSQMTVEEKAALLSGKDFWRTRDYGDKGINSIEVADGPCGVRKQAGACDHLAFNKSLPATAHVAGTALAASWDKELAFRVGEALGKECLSFGVDILLGPAVNIQRSPLCGRHFEYFSEDPHMTGKMASAFINGVQSQGIGACIKHFAANNQETEREYIDTLVEERSLREIYLAAFEEPVKKAAPWAVMTALNKINGCYCSENESILDDILRKEWGFEGIVMSDWWGVNDRVRALKAGLDLEMPYSCGAGQKRIEEAVKNNTLEEKTLDEACERIISCALKAGTGDKDNGGFDVDKNHQLARMAAQQSIVLLKNEDGVLPLKRDQKVAVIGEFAVRPRYRIEGSALVNPTKEDIPLEEIRRLTGSEVIFAKGYSSEAGEEEDLLGEAVKAALEADVVVLFAGLPTGVESEGRDREDISLPAGQVALIEAVARVQDNIIVVLANGGPVDMPWISKVKGVFECFLAGQAMGGALASLLYGLESPSGKLPVTFPKELCHTPAYLNFPGDKTKVEYREGIFVGYRYYDKKDVKPLFPFGHGLSYTTFSYSGLTLDKEEMMESETLKVSLKVKNTGEMAGREVVQLYVGQFDGTAVKPVKELKGFEKIQLEPGEEKLVTFELDKRSFAYYNTDIKDWYVDRGEYRIMVGSSSRDIRLQAPVKVSPGKELPEKITGWSRVGRFRETRSGREALEKMTKWIGENYCDEDLRRLFLNQEEESLKNQLDDLIIRFITLKTQTVINNDIMEEFLRECNAEYVDRFNKKAAGMNENES